MTTNTQTTTPVTFAMLLAAIPTKSSVPWQKKLYKLPELKNKEMLSNVPAQVRALIHVAQTAFKDKEYSGPELAKKAVELGELKTKQTPDIIFAYYRRHLDVFGQITARSIPTGSTKKAAAPAVEAPKVPAVPAQKTAAKGTTAAPKPAKAAPKIPAEAKANAKPDVAKAM